MPDFAQVYNFIGSVFDPDAGDHMQKLKQMDPINLETVCSFQYCVWFLSSFRQFIYFTPFCLVFCFIFIFGEYIIWGLPRKMLGNWSMFLGCFQALLLMKNLAINLTNPEFEDHVSSFSSFEPYNCVPFGWILSFLGQIHIWAHTWPLMLSRNDTWFTYLNLWFLLVASFIVSHPLSKVLFGISCICLISSPPRGTVVGGVYLKSIIMLGKQKVTQENQSTGTWAVYLIR